MQQQYCLRWNNHKTNLVTVFGELFRNEAFTDVTLACEGGLVIKCHKMVLAACSSYFHNLFSEISCNHPVILLKDIRYDEIQRILEYMYKGEVNLMQDEVAPLLRVGEALRVKGLICESDYQRNNDYPYNRINASSLPQYDAPISNCCKTSGAFLGVTSSSTRTSSLPNVHNQSHTNVNGGINESLINESRSYPKRNERNKSSIRQPFHKMPYLHGNTSNADESDEKIPILRPTNFPMRNTATANNSDMTIPPGTTSINTSVSKQEGSSLFKSKENDAPKPVSVICRNNGLYQEFLSNGATTLPQDIWYGKTLHSATSPSNAFLVESNSTGTISSAITNYLYVPSQKSEWKRYKQYTKFDITSAIESVRNGMTALKAAKKFGVPSRTLYDKVKKLGILSTRPSRKLTDGRSAFAYDANKDRDSLLLEISMSDMAEYKSQNSILEHGFLLKSGKFKIENSSHTALKSHQPLQHSLKVKVKAGMELEVNEQKFTSLMQRDTSRAPSLPMSCCPSSTLNFKKYVEHSNCVSTTSSSRSQVPLPNKIQDQVEDLSVFRN